MGGCCQASGSSAMTPAEQVSVFNLDMLEQRDDLLEKHAPDSLCEFTVLTASLAAERAAAQDALRRPGDPVLDRCLGSFLGLAAGDALGSPLEFANLRYGSTALHEMGQSGFWDIHPEFAERRPIRNAQGYNYFGLKPGQWTDDTSMALCLADSLLLNRGFNAIDLRLRFLNWWQFGYNNAFGKDAERRSAFECGSVGLGGNISQSLSEFRKEQAEYTATGNKMTSGNGSLMRLAPCAIFFRKDLDTALSVSDRQSRTTHQGDEAAECCRLLAHILLGAFRGIPPESEGAANSSASHGPKAAAKAAGQGAVAKAAGPKAVAKAGGVAARAAGKAVAKAKEPASRGRSSSRARSGSRGRSGTPERGAEISAARRAENERLRLWLLGEWCQAFESKEYSVECLAASCVESKPTRCNQGRFQKGEWTVVAESLPVKQLPFRGKYLPKNGEVPRGTTLQVEMVQDGFGNVTEPIAGWVELESEDGEILLERPGWQEERNWNWRAADFSYATSRASDSPDYIGSYAMDNLSMALHCVWTTDSFSAALLKAANMCGDADTVAAVVGQIAGAIYGASAIPVAWRQALEKWDGGDIALKAWLLFHREQDDLLSRALKETH